MPNNSETNEVKEIELNILRLLKGQTYGSAKMILNFALESLEYNSIVQKEIP
ncbi:hypothetical protein [Winogradskyella pacifica]|uniref:hypothetical protein n=1 Tax=Winogradskyella pacifica TaxID=664642 RepID=UPI0015C9173C|nr:hypothetical protein [Winogradskyella pacifica]